MPGSQRQVAPGAGPQLYAEEPQTAVQTPTAVYRDPNLRIIFAVTLIAVLGVSSVTPAFPTMQRSLGITPQATGLLITVFTLPGVVATPVLGMMADHVGRKRILVPSLFLFAAAGTALPLAGSMDLMLLLRFLQGLGAAALGSLNVTIIGDLYSGRRCTAAMGYNASVLSVGTAAYPAIGGALASLGWRYPFFLPVVAIPVGLLVLFRLDSPEPLTHQGLRQYLADAFTSVTNRRIGGLFLASLATFIIIYGAYLAYFPFLLADSFGGSSLVIGLIMSSMSITTALVSSQLGRLVRRSSERSLIVVAFLLYAAAMTLIPLVPSLWLFIVPATIFGLAQGVNVPSIQSLLARLAPPQHRGAFMSLNGMVLRLGQTLGPVIMGGAYAAWGMVGVYRTGAAVALLAAVIVGYTVRAGRGE